MTDPNADYDACWKEALELFLADLLVFAFPAFHAAIDWSRPYESREQELQALVRDADTGRRRHVDKLFQVYLRDGDVAWILVHIEIQGSVEAAFSRRMFVYNYRAFDRYNRPVWSLAILGDTDPDWRPNAFGYERGSFKMGIQFPSLKLSDFETRWSELEASSNPFAPVIMAGVA